MSYTTKNIFGLPQIERRILASAANFHSPPSDSGSCRSIVFYAVHGEEFHRLRLHKPPVITLEKLEYLFFFLQYVLHEQTGVFLLLFPFQIVLVIPEKEITLINLSEIVRFAQTMVDNAAERLHHVADK